MKHPTPKQVAAARKRAGLTQAQAAELVHLGASTRWAEYENGTRRIDLARWELFLNKIGTPMKPLFIPLTTQWFRAFKLGEKTVEYRSYGPRWNEHTCVPGRAVTLSHGYSGNRLTATVLRFEVINQQQTPEVSRRLFPHAKQIAAIH